jgi:acetyl esterase/lipase
MRLGIAAMLSLLAAACSPLAVFNIVTPKDGLAGPPARGVAYGEGPRRQLDVYRARGAQDAPVIVFFYGGGWDSGRRQDYAWAARALAAQGFTVVAPDYRLVPEVRFPTFLEDAAAAVRWTHDNIDAYGGDGDRIVLAGHSAGAYIAMMLALDARYLDAAGAPANAIRGAVGLAGPYDFYPWDADAARNAFAAHPTPADTQPVTFVRADAPPLLLLHGDADDTVRLRNSTRLAARVRGAGGTATVKVYDDIDHREIVLALSRPFRDRAATLADTAAFVREATR